MTESIDALILDLLEARAPRSLPYAEDFLERHRGPAGRVPA